MREEMARLMRKLRTAEAEVETKRSQAQRQAANAETLQKQLQELNAGAQRRASAARLRFPCCKVPHN